MSERGQLCLQGFPRAGLGKRWHESYRDTDRDEVKDHCQAAGHDGSQKQRDDRVLGQHAIENQHQRGGNNHAQGAAGGDGAGRYRACVPPVQHFGECHPGHRGGGGDRGSRYRAKAGAGANGGVDQSAFEVTECIICQSIQFSGQPTGVGEVAHYQKHGNDGQTLGCQRRGGLDRQQCQRGLKPDQNAGADHAHQCHGDAHRHLQQDHQK